MIFKYLPRFRTWSPTKRLLLPLAFILAFTAVFFALYPIIGGVAIILSFVPVAAIAWTMGKRAGLLAGALALLGNYVLLTLVGTDAVAVVMRGLLSSLTLILLGGLAGWVSELVEKLRSYARQLEQEREALVESNSRYQAVMMQSTACIFLVDVPTLRILEANASFLNLLGYTEAEVRALTLYDFVAHEPTSIQERVQIILEKGSYFIGERQYTARDGRCIDMEVRVNLIHYAGKEVMCVVSNDITARKRADAQMRTSLQEKEVLLKEIHHRVKNNLQIISSLLSLQSNRVHDPDLLAQFRDSQNRVRSMALIHERLYRSEDLAQVDFQAYLHDMTTHLLSSYRQPHKGVTLLIEAEGVFLDTDTAIPCGLIVNELVSNALKHAFPAEAHGTICISVRRSAEGLYTLLVRDDGVGLPPEIDPARSKSLGLQLVSSLARQLHGTISLRSENGATVEITFSPNRGHTPQVKTNLPEAASAPAL